MKSFFIGFFGATVALVLFLFASAQYGDYRVAAESNEWLARADDLKGQIEATILEQGNLSNFKARSDVTSSGAVETVVMDTGVIVIRGGVDGQLMVLVPMRAGNSFTWRCIGGPAKAMPSSCQIGSP